MTRMPKQLIRYWTAGKGAAEIKWGTPGDFDRCRRGVNEAIVKGGGAPLSDGVVSGLCSDLHQIATGARPGHAAGESKGKH